MFLLLVLWLFTSFGCEVAAAGAAVKFTFKDAYVDADS